ncbi:tetratricopeptide repeat protein [Olleya sp. R77988]|uniref:tetratricopeptide repeat protein n=1 Tax=Olleya sp. R77988 TaxID=3093875 RepID=UPI0037C9CF91
MKNITTILIMILAVVSCQNNSVSDADKKKAIELNDQAVELIMKGEINEAEKLYKQAFEIDKTNLNIHYALLGVYGQKKEIDKAFGLLNQLPEEQKKTAYYFQTKGGIFELDGNMEKAKENYVKAYELSEVGEIRNELDLNTLIGYAMIETFAGHKERAVNRINETLKTEWLTESNKEYLETFRNEFEFYQGNGSMEFENKTEITICTKNIDSLKRILKKHHINTSGSSSPIGKNKLAELRVNDKYRSGIEKLGLKECE